MSKNKSMRDLEMQVTFGAYEKLEDDTVKHLYEIKDMIGSVAYEISSGVHDCADKQTAIRCLREASMWACNAIVQGDRAKRNEENDC